MADHILYRLKAGATNPIEFPGGITTAYSCKWSFIIEVDDLFNVENPVGVDAYELAIVSALRTYVLKKEKIDGNQIGWHKLTCSFLHKPIDCDYSHCEINIRHEIFDDVIETNCMYSEIYTYELWSEAILNSDTKFYKLLRKDYRKDIIRLFNNPS